MTLLSLFDSNGTLLVLYTIGCLYDTSLTGLSVTRTSEICFSKSDMILRDDTDVTASSSRVSTVPFVIIRILLVLI